jgi:5-oxoprolinase (ATP-hydrolysing)
MEPPRSAEAVAEGFFEVANAQMAEAIRRITIGRGHDVREHALIVFGGAGGQHAAAVARRLGIRTLLFHPEAGVLSAIGMGLADVSWHGQADAGRVPLDQDRAERLEPEYQALEAEGRSALLGEGFGAERIAIARRIDLRYQGAESALTLDFDRGAKLAERFAALHREAFGWARPDRGIEVASIRVEVVGKGEAGAARVVTGGPAPEALEPRPAAETRLVLDGAIVERVPVFLREELRPGSRFVGPAIVAEATATVVVEPGFEATLAEDGLLWLRDRGRAAVVAPARSEESVPDPVRLEVMSRLYMSIAEQMGVVLRRTAFSTNIKERLDFSCAVFDAEGGLVANAPHIPVHLGAMGEAVAGVLRAHGGALEPGDVFLTNDPAIGGSHLPDLTVIAPVHAGSELLFFVANRGHHADVGGITPGSMPPSSERLLEEGVVFHAMRIVRAGRFERDAVAAAFSAGPHPARRVADNLADLEAQIAANQAGTKLLGELVAAEGRERVLAYMRHVQDNAAQAVARAIAGLPRGPFVFADALDDGTPIAVRITVEGEHLRIDFAGTGPQSVHGNLNAPPAIARSAVIYVLRALVGAPIPLNSGCLRPVSIAIPPGSILSPGPERAVTGGNVETSQRIVDVLLGALGLAAASQGTMNNLTFGDASFGYYETIAGGAGAGPGFSGASGVHTHMTNTRITDAEVLEARCPVRVIEFGLRRGSGGRGRWRGGDGVVRELEFLRPMSVAILSERRARAPFGLAGGEPGLPGRNLRSGVEVPGKVAFEVAAGERVRIETPGGGGYGPPG